MKIFSVLILPLTLTLLSSCQTPKAPSTEPLADTPDVHVERRVTIGGKVEQILTPQAFLLSGRKNSDSDLIVLTKRGIAPVYDGGKLDKNDRVFVTGSLRRLTLRDIETELLWTPSPALRADIISEEPVMIAELVEDM